MGKLIVGVNDLETINPRIAQEWDYTKNTGTPRDYVGGSTYRAGWICSNCGNTWDACIRDRVKSKWQSCPICTAVKRGQQRHLRALKKQGSITNPLLLKEWDYEKNDKAPTEYTPQSNDSVFWICSTCGYSFQAKINNRQKRNGGCACCSHQILVKGINDLSVTHPKLAAEWHPTKNGDLTPTDVTYGMSKSIWWLCPEGHEYRATLNHRSRGTNCPQCNAGRQTSFAEQAVFFYVQKVFPDAISRYTEIFSHGMEVDIYIPSIRLAIEYDGMAWHKEDKLEREREKHRICQEHGIKLLRLKEKMPTENTYTADEYLGIAGNMYEHKQLAQVIRFLLDKIDPESNMWTRRDPHSIHSRVDINIERDETAIRSYMTKISSGSLADVYPALAKEWHPVKNQGVSPDKVKPHSDVVVWWLCPVCNDDYKASVGHRANGTGCPKCGILKSARSKSKQVVMCDLTTHKEIRTFCSISEAGRELKIRSSNISMVCQGKRKNAGGYAWKYRDT